MTTDFRLYLLTWNVGETFPPKDLTKLLGLNGKTLPNLYAIGLQEMKSSTATRVSDLVFEDIWTSAITDCLSTRNYVRIKMRRLLGIHISVYVRRIDLPYITNVESECTKTGLGGFWGNKGALSIRLDAFGVNICIVNAHFTAHSENFRQRLEDYNLALETQRFRDKNSETILDHDYVFWMGDLNFRIDGISNEEVRRRAKEKDFDYLSKYDQLTKAVKDELIFLDFSEGPLTFPPTFKFDVGTDVYDTSAKNRVPSYCDRVLWRVHEDSYEGTDLGVEQLSYGCVMDEKTSDHKPVFSEFIIQVLKAPTELPVMFEPMGGWCQHKDNEVSYLVSSALPLNSRDWIGLYREGYKNWLDYVTYVWASGKGDDMHDGSLMHTVSFESRYLQRLPCDTYYLLYFSFIKNCVVGYSDGFRLLTTEESSASSSESEMEEEGLTDLRFVETDNIDDSGHNLSLNNSNPRFDQVDSEPTETDGRRGDDDQSLSSGEGEEVEEPSRQENSLFEYVEPDRAMMKQREYAGTHEDDLGGKNVAESKREGVPESTALEEVAELKERSAPRGPSSGKGGKISHGESSQLRAPLHDEPENQLYSEPEKSVPGDLDDQAPKDFGKPPCSELSESVFSKLSLAEPQFHDESKHPGGVEAEDPVPGRPDGTELRGSILTEPAHQAQTELARRAALEPKEQAVEETEKYEEKAAMSLPEESFLSDSKQSVLTLEKEIESGELVSSGKSLLENQSLLATPHQRDPTELVTDGANERQVASTDLEKSPSSESADRALAGQAPCSQISEPERSKSSGPELPNEPTQRKVTDPEQSPVTLSRTEEVLNTNPGSTLQRGDAEQLASGGIGVDKA